MKLKDEKLIVTFTTELVNDAEEVITTAFQRIADEGLDYEYKFYIDKEKVKDMLKRNKPEKVARNCKLYACPKCYGVVAYADKYCSNCGQALDFSEVK